MEKVQSNLRRTHVKKGISILLVLVLLLSTAGCAKPVATTVSTPQPTTSGVPATPAIEQTLVINMGEDVKTLDPALNSALNAGSVIMNTFEGLMKTDANNKAIPGIAEKYEVSADGMVYTFHLRDAKWSDGQAVTAGDFEYSWKRALSPELASEYSFQLYYLKNGEAYFEGTGSADAVGVKAIDEKTLQVTLESPTPYFLELTSFYTYFPVRKDMVEKNLETWGSDPTTAIGNGPFKLQEYKTGSELVLVKNQAYYNADAVKLEKITMLMINDTATALTAYESNEVDVLDELPNQEIPNLMASNDEFLVLPYLANYYYLFNTKEKPFDDVRVRKALSLAVDRRALVDTILKDGSTPASGFLPYGLKDSNGEDFREKNGNFYIDPEKADLEQAKKLLADAGYPDGKGFPKVQLLYNTSSTHKTIAEAIQEMWKKNLGIDLEMTNMEWAVFQSTLSEGKFQVAKANWFGDYVDPMTFLDLWTSDSGKSYTGWASPAYDEAIANAKKMSGTERDQNLYKAEALLMEDASVMPLYYYVDTMMVKKKVQGLRKTMLGYFYFDAVEITQ